MYNKQKVLCDKMNELDEIIQVPFKGQRDYVQSADIYDACIPLLGKLTSLSRGGAFTTTFIFRSFLRSQMRLLLPDEQTQEQVLGGLSLFGEIFIKTKDTQRVAYMISEQRSITERKQDCEAELRKYLSLDGGSISCDMTNVNLTPMESAVALTKFLHLDTVNDEVKWIATRLNFSQTFYDIKCDELKVKIVKNSRGKVTNSDVACDGIVVGNIMFNAM